MYWVCVFVYRGFEEWLTIIEGPSWRRETAAVRPAMPALTIMISNGMFSFEFSLDAGSRAGVAVGDQAGNLV